MSDTPIIYELSAAMAKFEEYEYGLFEAGVEIGRFSTIIAAKAEVQNTWNDGLPGRWIKMINKNGRHVLAYEQFEIMLVKKEKK